MADKGMATHIGVCEGICCIVTLAAMELGPQHPSLAALTGAETAASAPDLAATCTGFIKMDQQLEIWRVQCPPTAQVGMMMFAVGCHA